MANRINHISGGRSEILIKEPGWQPEYSGNNDRLLAEMKEFKFVKLEQSIQELWNYYENHIDEIDEKKLLL